MTENRFDRRDFIKRGGAAIAVSALPVSLVELVFPQAEQTFTFAHISDSHIQHIKGTEFVRNWDRGLIRAVAEVNMLRPKPDFVIFGGDLAQLGTREELDHGAEMLSRLKYKTYCVMGEHDYYLPYQREMVHVFKQERFPHEFIIIPGMGHTYPEDFPSHIDKAIEFILRLKNGDYSQEYTSILRCHPFVLRFL